MKEAPVPWGVPTRRRLRTAQVLAILSAILMAAAAVMISFSLGPTWHYAMMLILGGVQLLSNAFSVRQMKRELRARESGEEREP